jgi:hypothetical protein
VESGVANRIGFQFMIYLSIYFSLLLPERELEALDYSSPSDELEAKLSGEV